MEAELRFDVAAESDTEAVLALWKDAANWLRRRGIHQWRPEMFEPDEISNWRESGAELVVARDGEGTLAGTVIVCWRDPFLWEELDDGSAGYIHRLAVNRTLAGHGIGVRLLRWAEERIAAEGKRLVRLDCMADNPRLNRYYEDQTYRYVRVKRWDGWGASLYEKEANPPG